MAHSHFDEDEKLKELAKKEIGKDFDEEEAVGMASKMGEDATEEDVENVRQNLDKMNRGPLAKVWNKVVQLWQAFLSPDTPASLKVAIIGGLIYMVSPIDVIPDPVPIVGLLDDVSVIGIVFGQFAKFAASIGTAALIDGVIRLAEISVSALKKWLKQKKFKKLVVQEIHKKEMGKFISKNFSSGNFNTVSCLGLHEDGTEEQLVFDAEKISDDIYEGLVIHV